MDLDGDGRVDFHEFYAASCDHHLLFNEESKTIDKLFKILDHDKNGVIDQEDLYKVLPTNFNRKGKTK